MEMNWSRWFRCESSFGLLLVPAQPGIFALAEEIVQPGGPSSRRMLAVFEVEEADDLAWALSRLFASTSPWRRRLAEGRCYLRYAVAVDAEERHAAAAALKNWLSSQRETAEQIFADREPEPATVTERAVDRVARTKEYEKVFPAGF
ncbi:MAG TPA: hypothetical protein VI488_18595 [Candidatus Angelobacter sp.]